jgi:hypothetical protein
MKACRINFFYIEPLLTRFKWQVYMNAIQAFVPTEVVQTFATFLEFYYIARRDVITDRSLEQLKVALHKFHESRQIFSGTVWENGLSGFSLPRQHSMVHYYNNIKNFGSPNGLCSSIIKLKHITAVKRPWRRSNQHVALPQMLKVNQRLDKLAAARADFTARGMLVDSCLIHALRNSLMDCNHKDPMDEDASNSDETDSGNSDDVYSFHTNYADTHNLHNTTTEFNDANTHSLANTRASTPNPGVDAPDDTDTSTPDGDDDYSRALPNDDEDNDHGPVESGPLMNEVRLMSKKGQKSLPSDSHALHILISFIAPTREYPTSFTALGMKIGQHNLLDLTWHFLFDQLNPELATEPDQLSLEACPVVWDSTVSVYLAATATFRAPSNPSGPGEMY